MLAKVARRRYALFRKWDAAGYHNQSSRFPQSNDDRDAGGEYGREGRRYAWPCTGRDSFQVSTHGIYVT